MNTIRMVRTTIQTHLFSFFIVSLLILPVSNISFAEEPEPSENNDFLEEIREEEKEIEEASKQRIAENRLSLYDSEQGSLDLNLILQTGLDIFPNQVERKKFGFSMQRARFGLSGHVLVRELTFQLTGDLMPGAISPTRSGYPGSEILPDNERAEVPVLLDARMNWAIPDMGITLSAGRFIPKWGLLMGEDVNDLGAISYPLYLDGGVDSIGIFRTVGIEAEVELFDFLDLGGGVYNGGKNTWLDDNDRKDILFYASTDFLPGLIIRASSLFAFPNQWVDGDGDTAYIINGYETHILTILEARYRDMGFDAMLGLTYGAIIRSEESVRADYDAYGFLAHLGYLVMGDWFQIMGRFEGWEPSNETEDNEQYRFTLGPQFLIKGKNLQININYIQDFYGSREYMCEMYLGLSYCHTSDLPEEARREAASILIQLNLAI